MEKSKDGLLFQVLKGSGVAVLCSLVFVLIFAFVIKLADIPENVIISINQIIKVLCIAVGCFLSVRQDKGLIKGVIIGIVVVISTYLIFALISKSISFDWTNILELVFGAIIGAICGVVTVNLRKV